MTLVVSAERWLSLKGLVKPAIILFWLLLSGCSTEESGPIVVSGPTMGTQFNVKYYSVSANGTEEVKRDIERRLAQVNQLMSTYLQDSEVSRFNGFGTDQWFAVSKATADVVSLALTISEQTGGAFDVTVASLVDLWGFGPTYREPELPSPQDIEQELEWVGYQSLEVRLSPPAQKKKTPLTLDLSAIAKGYAVDQVAQYLDEQGIESYMVEVGGEIRARGTKPGSEPWRIAIELPVPGQRSVQRVLDLTDIAVATSGDYRNYFEQEGKRYSHTIDPVTGYPITHQLASVTVLADTSARADALATALNVMGDERALAFANKHNLPVLLIVKDGAGFVEHASSAFSGWLN